MTPQELILQTVDANNGAASYEQVVEALPQVERQKTLIYCRQLEGEGKVKRVLSLDPASGKSSLTIEKAGT